MTWWAWVQFHLQDSLVSLVWISARIIRGFLMIARDIHTRLVARFGDRVYAGYAIGGFVLMFAMVGGVRSWFSGVLLGIFQGALELVASLAVLAIVVFGLYLIITSPFRGKSGGAGRRKR